MEWIVALAIGILASSAGWFLLAGKKRRAESWRMVAGRFEDGLVRGGELKYVRTSHILTKLTKRVARWLLRT